VAIVFLIAIAAVAYRNAHGYVETNAGIAKSYQVLEKLSVVVSRLNDAESQQRALLITGDDRYLKWRDRLFADIGNDVAELRKLTADNPFQQRHIPALEQRIAARLETMEGTRHLRDTQGIEAAARRISSGVGPVAVENIRSVLQAMETEERRLLEQRNEQVKTDADVLLATSAVLLLVISLFLGWLLRLIRAHIVERKRAEQSIRNLNAHLHQQTRQLEAANKELEGFSYSVSHDLRAPLRAIDGFAQMLEEDHRNRLDREGLRFLSVIRNNSKRMGILIDDLLTFSRLSRQAVSKSEVDMNRLVQEVIDELRPHQGVENAKIELGTLPPAEADRALIRQVWLNLLSNALKYSAKSPNPVIEVTGCHDGVDTIYTVRDNGVGFSMDYASKLFGVFQRLHRAEEFSGTGVGLAIVQRLVARHGGRVWAEGSVNNGARFSFALPVMQPQESA
jgi:signal transduction histidine kinase